LTNSWSAGAWQAERTSAGWSRALGTAEEWLSFYQRFWTERFDALESALKAQDVAAAAKTAAR
jgi:hypothetical protein